MIHKKRKKEKKVELKVATYLNKKKKINAKNIYNDGKKKKKS